MVCRIVDLEMLHGLGSVGTLYLGLPHMCFFEAYCISFRNAIQVERCDRWVMKSDALTAVFASLKRCELLPRKGGLTSYVRFRVPSSTNREPAACSKWEPAACPAEASALHRNHAS